jgi:hypothetical protein
LHRPITATHSLELLVVLLHQVGVHADLGWGQSGGSNELQRRVANELSCKPQEGLLEIVVGLGRELEVLQVLLAVEGDGSGLDFAFL